MFHSIGDVVANYGPIGQHDGSVCGAVWSELQQHAGIWADNDDRMALWLMRSVLEAENLAAAVSRRLATLYAGDAIGPAGFIELVRGVLDKRPDLLDCMCADLLAIRKRDPAAREPLTPFLFFKGFAAITCHRIAHHLWCQGTRPLAAYLHHRVAVVSGVDIHPGARIGRGVLMDHATGVVIGETAVVGDDVTLFHNVTLGGTGKDRGDRHPKVGDGVLIGTAAMVLGNIKIGAGARIGAGSVVLHDIPERSVVIGGQATVRPPRAITAMAMRQETDRWA